MYRTFPAIAAAILVLSAPTAVEANWPQFHGTSAGASEDGTLPSKWSTRENVAWTVRLGAHTYGNPTVADGRVYVGTDSQSLRGDPRFGRQHVGVVNTSDIDTGNIRVGGRIPRTDV